MCVLAHVWVTHPACGLGGGQGELKEKENEADGLRRQVAEHKAARTKLEVRSALFFHYRAYLRSTRASLLGRRYIERTRGGWWGRGRGRRWCRCGPGGAAPWQPSSDATPTCPPVNRPRCVGNRTRPVGPPLMGGSGRHAWVGWAEAPLEGSLQIRSNRTFSVGGGWDRVYPLVRDAVLYMLKKATDRDNLGAAAATIDLRCVPAVGTLCCVCMTDTDTHITYIHTHNRGRARLFLVRSAVATDSRSFDKHLPRILCVIVGRRDAGEAPYSIAVRGGVWRGHRVLRAQVADRHTHPQAEETKRALPPTPSKDGPAPASGGDSGSASAVDLDAMRTKLTREIEVANKSKAGLERLVQGSTGNAKKRAWRGRCDVYVMGGLTLCMAHARGQRPRASWTPCLRASPSWPPSSTTSARAARAPLHRWLR
jgi:hypothetical protein